MAGKRGLLCPRCWSVETIEEIGEGSKNGTARWRERVEIDAELDVFGNNILDVKSAVLKETIHRCSNNEVFISYDYEGLDFLVEKVGEDTYKLVGKFWLKEGDDEVVVKLERDGERVVLRDVNSGKIYMEVLPEGCDCELE